MVDDILAALGQRSGGRTGDSSGASDHHSSGDEGAVSEQLPDKSLLHFWYAGIERFGFAAVTLIVVLYVVRTDLIQPLVRSHDQFIQEVIRNSRDHTELLRAQTELLREVRSLVAGRASDEN